MSPFTEAEMREIDRAAERRVAAEEFAQGRKVLETLREIRAAFPLIEAPHALLEERADKALGRRFSGGPVTGFGGLSA